MKPIIILPPDTMSPEDIKLLRENDLCVVEAKDPLKVKFVDPIPCASQRGKIESAAIGLSRILLSRQWGAYSAAGSIGSSEFTRIYIDLLMKGTELDPAHRSDEQIFEAEKYAEITRLAREEARAERKAAKESAKSAKGKAAP